MKSTGVVRRMDDLGRIVIPKELRRTLKIREGEELEIFLEEDKIILKKYSRIGDVIELSKKLIDVISEYIDKTILVTNSDKIVCSSGNLKKKYLNKNVSNDLLAIMNNNKSIVKKELSDIKIIEDVEDKYAYIINPIVYYGNTIGSVIIISNISNISELDVSMGKLIVQFLGKYVED